MPGLTVTQAWTTTNVLNTKVELDNQIAKGMKAEVAADFIPSSKDVGAKLNLTFKQPNFHARAFFDLMKGPTANIDAVLGREGFLVGAEAGYDVQKAAITRYAAAVGYSVPQYSAAITASNNLSVFSAAYYHKVNSEVEAGAKATWDSKGSNNVGLEVAGKWRRDPTSFAKAKVNDRGIASLAYNVLLRSGVTVGAGISLDTQKLNESAHKVGTHFEFNG
ncbi:Mitochondrial porin [Xanthoria parietina]